jgi:predicted RNA-binding protein with PIN domain
LKELIIVDGYNFIFDYYRKDIKGKNISSKDLSYLRERLIKDLIEYRSCRNCDLTVVFDAKHRNNIERNDTVINEVKIVYSSRGETADSVIEKMINSVPMYNRIFVVTSDYTQQKVIFRDNIFRKSIREFVIEISNLKEEIEEKIKSNKNISERSFYKLEKRLNYKSKENLSKL